MLLAMNRFRLVRHLPMFRIDFESSALKIQRRSSSTTEVRTKFDNVICSNRGDCHLLSLTPLQRFVQQASQWPHAIALECGITGRRYTYNQVRIYSRRFGSCLLRMGFQQGEILAVILPNLPEYPLVVFGAAGIGMPVTSIHLDSRPSEMARQIQNSGACIIVTIPEMVECIRQISKGCPRVRSVVLIGGVEEGCVTFADMLQDSGDLFDENIDINAQEDAFIIPYSSGTTGLAKAALLTHFNVATNIQQLRHPGTSRNMDTTESFQEVFLCPLPFTHVDGQVLLMLTSLDHGAKLITLPSFNPATFIKAVHDHKPTALHLVPPLLPFVNQYPSLKIESLQRLHTVYCTGAPFAVADANQLLERLNRNDVNLQEGYGLTESLMSHISPLTNSKIGSCGTLLSRTRAKILDLNTGTALGPGEKGELCISGPQIMKQYYNDIDATKEVIDPSGWFHTGDVAYYDQDEHFYIVDRLQEMIQVKDIQVSPSELEDVLRQHPSVMDVAVVGVPHGETGDKITAFIVKRDGDSTSERDLEQFILSKVAPHQQLQGGVAFVDVIPKSSTGKMLRRELKNHYLHSL